MHHTLLRRPGPGCCADPLMCSAALFPNARGEYRFRPAWRAREAEINTLARRAYEKKKRARRLETLYDTTLCKVLQSTAEPHAAASTMLQIDVRRLFRQGLRDFRVHTKPESHCNFGRVGRIIHGILGLTSAPI